MFKITKILNSGVNVPETVSLPVTASAAYEVGCALKLTAGAAAHCAATDKPAFICAEKKAAASTGTVKAYPVTSDLVLECAVSASPASLAVGNAVTLAVDDRAMATGVTATVTNGVATVCDLLRAKATGDKIQVRIL